MSIVIQEDLEPISGVVPVEVMRLTLVPGFHVIRGNLSCASGTNSDSRFWARLTLPGQDEAVEAPNGLLQMARGNVITTDLLGSVNGELFSQGGADDVRCHTIDGWVQLEQPHDLVVLAAESADGADDLVVRAGTHLFVVAQQQQVASEPLKWSVGPFGRPRLP